ncbi:hypothetical protein Sjap_022195 [Stephania japonica]|uniref:Uncharacterized protein n=1 Tax=Stephania japonica TaxID=461633 RepID=A0AAP0EVN9_9MAGN
MAKRDVTQGLYPGHHDQRHGAFSAMAFLITSKPEHQSGAFQNPDSFNSVMASYSDNYSQFEDSYYESMNGVGMSNYGHEFSNWPSYVQQVEVYELCGDYTHSADVCPYDSEYKNYPYWGGRKGTFEDFCTADTFVLDDSEIIDSYLLEVLDKLPFMNKDVPSLLPSAPPPTTGTGWPDLSPEISRSAVRARALYLAISSEDLSEYATSGLAITPDLSHYKGYSRPLRFSSSDSCYNGDSYTLVCHIQMNTSIQGCRLSHGNYAGDARMISSGQGICNYELEQCRCFHGYVDDPSYIDDDHSAVASYCFFHGRSALFATIREEFEVEPPIVVHNMTLTR